MSGMNNILYSSNNFIEINGNKEIEISTKVSSSIDYDMIISNLSGDNYVPKLHSKYCKFLEFILDGPVHMVAR